MLCCKFIIIRTLLLQLLIIILVYKIKIRFVRQIILQIIVILQLRITFILIVLFQYKTHSLALSW